MSTQPAGSAWIPDDSTFGARLALIRHGKGWNEKEAALACGFPYSTWRRWEAGSNPHNLVEVSEQIAARTGADEEWVLRGRRRPSGGPGTTEGPRPTREGGSGGTGAVVDGAFGTLRPPVSKPFQWRTAA